MRAAEIVVWFGDTLLDHRQLATGTYRIGTGRDVDLALLGLTSFPLVEWSERGCSVRVPAGVEGTSGLLRPGERVELAIHPCAITIQLVDRLPALPKRRPDPVWPRWIAGALVAHLIALVAIETLAEPEPPTIQAPSLASLIAQLPETSPPPPPPPDRPRMHVPRKPGPRRAAVAAPVEPSEPAPIELAPEPVRRRARAVEGARRAGVLGTEVLTADQLRALTGTKDLEKELSDVGGVYRDYEAEAKAFGGGRRFDPTRREGWGTVETGRYATVGSGRAAGDRYALPGEVAARPQPRVAHCVGACTATGGLSREAIHTAIARHEDALLGCYERGARGVRGDVVVELAIGEDGKVITSDGAGLGAIGGCVAGVLRRVAFPRAAPTTVRYPLSFTPS